MLLNSTSLTTLRTSFDASFQRGLGQAGSQYSRVATTINSTTKTNEYGWLGKFPKMRKWLGDRVVNGIAAHKYSITNEPYENTIGVDRDDIEDDNVGIYGPLFQEMGLATASHPDELVWPLMKDGFNQLCYDGQNYFDTDHPVLDENGNETSVANTDGGAGTPWFLIDDSRALKPIIYQNRRSFTFTAMDDPTDPNVFNKKEFLYGVDGRNNVGFGLWQFAWGSKQTLNKANYEIARQSLMGMKGDYGRPLGIMPKILVVPPALEGKGLEIVNAENDAAGATNVYKGTAELVVVPWLA